MTTNSRSRGVYRFCVKGVLVSSALLIAGWAQALRFEPTDEITIDLDTTVSYGAMWRVEEMDEEHTGAESIRCGGGPVSPGVGIEYWRGCAGFGAGVNLLSESPEMLKYLQLMNSDDGNRNFAKGDMTSSRFSVISDMDINFGDYGIFLRGRAFYDSVYFEETSWTGEGWDYYVYPGGGPALPGPGAGCQAASVPGEQCGYQGPETINNTMAAGLISDPTHFSERAKEIHGADVGFLDAYVYGTFEIGERLLDLRIGKQAISWGEALMLQGGIGFAQNRIDASAATAPGQQLKEIFLPTGTVYGQIDLTPELTMEAYWQYEWKKSVLMASDSFFGFTDFLDTGFFHTPSRLDDLCGRGNNTTVQNGVNTCDGTFTGINSYIVEANQMTQAPDIEPENEANQWGLAFRWLLENGSEAGVYFLRYHDRYPSFWASNNGGVLYAATPGAPDSTENAPGLNTQRFTIEYKEAIKMMGLTYNTVVGDIQMGFELTWRANQPVVPGCDIRDLMATTAPAVEADFADVSPDVSDVRTACKDPSVPFLAAKNYRGIDDRPLTNGWDMDVDTLFLLQEKTFSWPTQAEVWTYNIGMTAVVPPTPLWDTGIFVAEVGGWYVGSGFEDEDLRRAKIGSFTEQGVGVSAIFLPQYKNVLGGLDITIPMFVNYTIDGSFAYYNYTKGALWFAIGVEAIYLSNTSFGITYNTFGGASAWRDRDNVSFNIKYTF